MTQIELDVLSLQKRLLKKKIDNEDKKMLLLENISDSLKKLTLDNNNQKCCCHNKDVYISCFDDCEENTGGYYCQVYDDESLDNEIDNFCIHLNELHERSLINLAKEISQCQLSDETNEFLAKFKEKTLEEILEDRKEQSLEEILKERKKDYV